jgi:hypothetical protein
METGLQGLLERSVVGVSRRTAVLIAVLITSLFGLCLASAAVRADVNSDGGVLCSGYSACSTDGFTDNDYAANQATSWWRMYPGNNCTNYVAYVESQVFGVTQPTYLLGDAYLNGHHLMGAVAGQLHPLPRRQHPPAPGATAAPARSRDLAAGDALPAELGTGQHRCEHRRLAAADNRVTQASRCPGLAAHGRTTHRSPAAGGGDRGVPPGDLYERVFV